MSTTKNEIMAFILTIVMLFFVMGVFMAIASPDLQPQVGQARNNVDKLNLKIVNQAIQRYNLDQGAYPKHLSQLVPEYLNEVPQVQQRDKKLLYQKKAASYKLAID